MPVLLLLLPLLITAAGGGGGASANAYITHSMTQPYSSTPKMLAVHMYRCVMVNILAYDTAGRKKRKDYAFRRHFNEKTKYYTGLLRG